MTPSLKQVSTTTLHLSVSQFRFSRNPFVFMMSIATMTTFYIHASLVRRCPTYATRADLLEAFWPRIASFLRPYLLFQRRMWFPFLLAAALDMIQLSTVPPSKLSLLGKRLDDH